MHTKPTLRRQSQHSSTSGQMKRNFGTNDSISQSQQKSLIGKDYKSMTRKQYYKHQLKEASDNMRLLEHYKKRTRNFSEYLSFKEKHKGKESKTEV